MNKAKKLSRAEFARAIKLGHGRALLHVLEYGDSGIEKEICKALIKNYVYDSQCEDLRCDWLWRIITASGNLKNYARFVLADFGKANATNHDFSQQYEIAVLFLNAGFVEFRDLLIANFQMAVTDANLFCTYSCALIDVAGLAGLEHAIKLAESEQCELREWECYYVIEHAMKLLYESEVNDLLNRLAETNKAARFHLDAWTKMKAELESPPVSYKSTRLTLEQILAMIVGGDNSKLRSFGRTASTEDLQQIVNLLRQTENQNEQLAYLRIFNWRSLPEVELFLLDLLYSPNEKIARAVETAFSNTESALIRAEALKLLDSKSPELICRGLALMRKNYLSEDCTRILNKIKLLKNDEHIHSAGLDIKHLCDRADGTELTPALLWLYEQGPDSFCRRSFVEELIDLGQCPDEILYEAQWDASEDLQLLARSRSSSH